jgi:transcriptional regulator with PAS, ATPase and Fis domain
LPEFLPADFQEPESSSKPNMPARHVEVGSSSLNDLECMAIKECLDKSNGNRKRTAKLLGISTRTLLRKIRKYGLEGAPDDGAT